MEGKSERGESKCEEPGEESQRGVRMKGGWGGKGQRAEASELVVGAANPDLAPWWWDKRRRGALGSLGDRKGSI